MKKKLQKRLEKLQFFNEAYTIKGNYIDDDGFLKYINETQLVKVKHGVNEKDNHEEAADLFIKAHKHLKNLEITAITYD